MLLQLASAASALLLAPAAPQVGPAMLPCSRRCAVQCSETAEYDVVVIGSGIGGLSAAAAAASTGLSVAVLESHDAPGGAAHEWTVKGFHFESGPSLYAGLSPEASPNPLKHVFQIIGEEPEWLTYDRWGTYLPDGDFAAAVGADDFVAKLETYGGPDAQAQARRSSVRFSPAPQAPPSPRPPAALDAPPRTQWARLMARIRPLGDAIFGLPSAAVRHTVVYVSCPLLLCADLRRSPRRSAPISGARGRGRAPHDGALRAGPRPRADRRRQLAAGAISLHLAPTSPRPDPASSAPSADLPRDLPASRPDAAAGAILEDSGRGGRHRPLHSQLARHDLLPPAGARSGGGTPSPSPRPDLPLTSP